MTVWHHARLGLRQVAGALKSKGKTLASSTKSTVGGGLTEAKHVAKDVEEPPPRSDRKRAHRGLAFSRDPVFRCS